MSRSGSGSGSGIDFDLELEVGRWGGAGGNGERIMEVQMLSVLVRSADSEGLASSVGGLGVGGE